MKTKVCKICQRELPKDKDHFYRLQQKARKIDGTEVLQEWWDSYCIDCGKKKRKENAQRNSSGRRKASRKHYQTHKEQRAEKHAKYYRENKTKVKELARRHYEANKATYKVRSLVWQKEHGWTSTTRIRRYNAEHVYWKRKDIIERDCRTCRICGKKQHGAIHIDHIIPLDPFFGGTDTPDNLQVLCVPCHRAKTATEASLKAQARRS